MSARRSTLLLCPDCGAALAVDRTARVSVEYASQYRDRPNTRGWAPAVVEHCTRCEWTREVERLDPLPRGGRR